MSVARGSTIPLDSNGLAVLIYPNIPRRLSRPCDVIASARDEVTARRVRRTSSNTSFQGAANTSTTASNTQYLESQRGDYNANTCSTAPAYFANRHGVPEGTSPSKRPHAQPAARRRTAGPMTACATNSRSARRSGRPRTRRSSDRLRSASVPPFDDRLAQRIEKCDGSLRAFYDTFTGRTMRRSRHRRLKRSGARPREEVLRRLTQGAECRSDFTEEPANGPRPGRKRAGARASHQLQGPGRSRGSRPQSPQQHPLERKTSRFYRRAHRQNLTTSVSATRFFHDPSCSRSTRTSRRARP